MPNFLRNCYPHQKGDVNDITYKTKRLEHICSQIDHFSSNLRILSEIYEEVFLKGFIKEDWGEETLEQEFRWLQGWEIVCGRGRDLEEENRQLRGEIRKVKGMIEKKEEEMCDLFDRSARNDEYFGIMCKRSGSLERKSMRSYIGSKMVVLKIPTSDKESILVSKASSCQKSDVFLITFV